MLALARATRGTDMEGYREEFTRMVETSRTLTREAPPAIPGVEIRTSRTYGSARLTLFEP